MTNQHELLRQKRSELARAAKEVDALRIVAPLLLDEEDRGVEPADHGLPFALEPDSPSPNGATVSRRQ
jgi:hypothetical protein